MTIFWRIAHYFVNQSGGSHLFARFFEFLNCLICSNSISAHTEIGIGTHYFHRGLGCVIQPKTKIGDNCQIFQNVTIGSKWSAAEGEGEAPTIGKNVLLGAGCVILGDVHIGDGAIVGANAVVLNEVLPRQVVGGIPTKVLHGNKDD